MRMKLLWCYALISPIIFTLVVFILGFISPGYDHLRNTISELILGEYGFVQKMNFIQFGLGFVLSGYLLPQFVSKKRSKRIWMILFWLCALFSFTISIFQTDKMDQFSKMNFSVSGKIHFGALILSFLLAPFGVHALKNSLKNELVLSKYTNFTGQMGYTLCILCHIWTFLFLGGYLVSYLGIFQKIIVIISVYWLVTILWAIHPADTRNDH